MISEGSMRGTIFDIRRFSTHDGDGIRTTVFFKGCPLRCVWCQNPEGISPEILPMYMENKCIHCGTCLHFSEKGGVYQQGDKIRIRRTCTDNWEEITDACPTGALVMDASVYESDELVRELLKDRVFFKRGGGITLSGGEPLMQGAFALEILKKLKEEGIHTAIETALNVPPETVEAAVPYLDQIYADLKIADSQKHRKYTGASNGQIKKNVGYLLQSPHRDKVIIRTPLIPEYTATEENLSAIARFLTQIYPEVHYELLNYNPLAEAKYHLVNRKYCFQENPHLYTAEQMEKFGQIVRENGIKNLIMEI